MAKYKSVYSEAQYPRMPIEIMFCLILHKVCLLQIFTAQIEI